MFKGYIKELIGDIETIYTCRSEFKYMHLYLFVDILYKLLDTEYIQPRYTC